MRHNPEVFVESLSFVGSKLIGIAHFRKETPFLQYKTFNTENMSKVIISCFEDLEKQIGNELGVSGDHKITQEQIDIFAKATIDHQWIHTEPERAKVESPFKSTIAHGYLTLSLLPYLWDQIVEVRNLKLMVNYGIEKMKFNQPVLVDSVVRLRASVVSVLNLRGTIKTQIHVSLEIEGSKKSAYDADVIFLYHFNS
ncbi:MAG: MaoC family dehydratase [Prolixibacteraceae bacterium]